MTTLGIFGLGAPELIVIVLLVVIFFGGKKIPELARGLGKGIREFKDASKSIKDEFNDEVKDQPKKSEEIKFPAEK